MNNLTHHHFCLYFVLSHYQWRSSTTLFLLERHFLCQTHFGDDSIVGLYLLHPIWTHPIFTKAILLHKDKPFLSRTRYQCGQEGDNDPIGYFITVQDHTSSIIVNVLFFWGALFRRSVVASFKRFFSLATIMVSRFFFSLYGFCHHRVNWTGALLSNCLLFPFLPHYQLEG